MAIQRPYLLRQALYFAPWGFLKLTGILPLSISRLLGISLAALAYYLVPRIRRIGLENLDLAYGNTLDYQAKKRILRASVRNLGLVAAEFSSMPRLLSRHRDSLFSVEGAELVDFRRGGQVLISAHLGNWEWIIPAVSSQGLRIIVVVREFDDPRTNALVEGTRRSGGGKRIPKDNALGQLIQHLREGWSAGLMVDQNPRENAVPVQFFGKRAWSTIGPAMLALRTGAPIHPVSMLRKPDGAYVLRFFPALELSNTGNVSADIQENTQHCQDALERIIREHPEQWLWFHRRWRLRERLEQEWIERMEQGKSDTKPSRGRSQERVVP